MLATTFVKVSILLTAGAGIMAQEAPEELVAKRNYCPPGGGDSQGSCPHWKKLGFCASTHMYSAFMASNCPSSCGLCEARPTPAPRPFEVKVDKNECLKAHNSKRALHGAHPLDWDDSLARDAQEWANRLARTDTFQHGPKRGQGENLYYSSRFGKTNNMIATCDDAVEAWYSEVKDYPFEEPPYSIFDVSEMIGHFTQIVWKSTKRLGVGIAAIKRGWDTKTYVVARYSPPGNYMGELGQQVGRLQG